MAKVTLKDLNYTAYELGIAQGRATITAHFSGKRHEDDPLALLERLWPDHSLDEFEEMLMEEGAVEEVVEAAKNFMDGIEDGVRSGVSRWLKAYKKSFD